MLTTITFEGEPNQAVKLLRGLDIDKWGMPPGIFPVAEHGDHFHPVGVLGFDDMDHLPILSEVLVGPDSPIGDMGPPPVPLIGCALIWEGYVRGGPYGEGITVGDHPDDEEVRLCIVFIVGGGKAQAAQVRSSGDIGEPFWSVPSNFPVDPETMERLGQFANHLAALSPEFPDPDTYLDAKKKDDNGHNED